MSEYLDFPDGFNFKPHKDEPEESTPEQQSRDSDPQVWFVQEITAARAELQKWNDTLIDGQVVDTIPEGMTWRTNLPKSATNISYMYASILQEKGYGIAITPSSIGPEKFRHISDNMLSIYEDRQAHTVFSMAAELDKSLDSKVLQATLPGDFHVIFTSEAIRQRVWTGDELPKGPEWWEYAGLETVSRMFMTSLILGNHHKLEDILRKSPTTINLYTAMHRNGFRPFNLEALYGMAEARIDSAISRYRY